MVDFKPEFFYVVHSKNTVLQLTCYALFSECALKKKGLYNQIVSTFFFIGVLKKNFFSCQLTKTFKLSIYSISYL